MTDGFLSLVYIGSKDNVQPLCLDAHGPWNTKRSLVLLHPKVVKGLIQVTLVGILAKPFEGSLSEIDVKGLSWPLYLSSLVCSEVSLTRTQWKPDREQLSCSHSHAHVLDAK